jgi:quercetin dioxygenase-like cupin family protein
MPSKDKDSIMGTVLNTAELLNAKNVKASELSELGVAPICIPPGQEGIAHSHTLVEEVVIVHKGKGAIQIEDETYKLRPGSVAVVPAGQFHALCNTGKKNFEATAIFNSNVDRSKVVLLDRAAHFGAPPPSVEDLCAELQLLKKSHKKLTKKLNKLG